MTKRRALLSVSDKTGIVDFGVELVTRGWELLSTGGTAKALLEGGLPVTEVSEITGHPEMMEGRVKTLHPAIHGGILARRDRGDDLAALSDHGYGLIDLLAVNLYPFQETIAREGVSVGEAMAQVDIGGPTMIRAAAKNHTGVWVVIDPADYPEVLAVLDGERESEAELRRMLASKVFAHMSGYDAAVSEYLSTPEEAEEGSNQLDIRLRDGRTLRYGENPDQSAAFYPFPGGHGLGGLDQLHGKELSYNNLLDLDGALLALAPFARSEKPAVCILKHTTPCGVAVADTLVDAYRKALETDPVSAFGSVISLNRPVDLSTAETMAELFVECIVAPAFEADALGLLSEKKNLRLLIPGPSSGEFEDFLSSYGRIPEPIFLRSVYGGVLAQAPPEPPSYGEIRDDWKVVTNRNPTDDELDDLRFAWAAVFSVKSNAILLARDGGTLGIGAGQMSRVDSSKIAVRKAGEAGLSLDGAVLASDAFFPFRDGVDAAAAAGVKAIVQPGGSVRDQEVIDAADEHGIAMVFTGRRLFRH